ncbi:MAG: cob(I)yrinic acid a,c-diamide adenosyltransferase [Candidatus Aenigmarchaeota archaeon]|nr:cob(I)yrinic acid a,c-diamide adenosyltransferase [Candidatus Aenigmarchaeota archaeon]
MAEIYIFTGSGAGKTTNALGLALRSLGHGHKVIVIQFLKYWKQTGEYLVQDRFDGLYEIHQFGRKDWIGLENLGDEDKKLVKDAMEFTETLVANSYSALQSSKNISSLRSQKASAFCRNSQNKKPHLLILDELNLAAHCRLAPIGELVEFLKKLKEYTEMTIVITGRHAPKEFEDIADYVNVIEEKKKPKEMKSIKGIQW